MAKDKPKDTPPKAKDNKNCKAPVKPVIHQAKSVVDRAKAPPKFDISDKQSSPPVSPTVSAAADTHLKNRMISAFGAVPDAPKSGGEAPKLPKLTDPQGLGGMAFPPHMMEYLDHDAMRAVRQAIDESNRRKVRAGPSPWCVCVVELKENIY